MLVLNGLLRLPRALLTLDPLHPVATLSVKEAEALAKGREHIEIVSFDVGRATPDALKQLVDGHKLVVRCVSVCRFCSVLLLRKLFYQKKLRLWACECLKREKGGFSHAWSTLSPVYFLPIPIINLVEDWPHAYVTMVSILCRRNEVLMRLYILNAFVAALFRPTSTHGSLKRALPPRRTL